MWCLLFFQGQKLWPQPVERALGEKRRGIVIIGIEGHCYNSYRGGRTGLLAQEMLYDTII